MPDQSPDLVWLVRHGQSAANAGLATEHPSSIALTEIGREQAARIATQINRAPDWMAVSPFARTTDTARPSLLKFPAVPVLTWPIQELTYLSPVRCRGTRAVDRKVWAQTYWAAADPLAIDGEGAESFAEFMARVRHFETLLSQTPGHGVVFGHGMFLKAFLIALEHGFEASPQAMQRFRQLESAEPIVNGQIMVLPRRRLGTRA